MADPTPPGLGDLFSLLGGNPIASVGKNIDTFRKGVEGFVAAVGNFNRTMETMDGIATRVNALLDEVEEPIRVLMPQVTRATKQSLALLEKVSEPMDRMAPGLDRLADTLASPTFASLPNVMSDFMEMMGELMNRLRPLGQLAEAAGSMFGMKAFASLIPGAQPASPAPAPARPAAPTAPAAPRAATTATRSTATPVPAKRATTARRSPNASASKTGSAKTGSVKTSASKAGAAKQSKNTKTGSKKAGAAKPPAGGRK